MILEFILRVCGSPLVPIGGACPTIPIWSQQPGFKNADNYTFQTSRQRCSVTCLKDPTAYVDFPMINHGAHEIYLDGKLYLQFSDPHFKSVRSITASPRSPAKKSATAKVIEWRAFTDSKYFARFRSSQS